MATSSTTGRVVPRRMRGFPGFLGSAPAATGESVPIPMRYQPPLPRQAPDDVFGLESSPRSTRTLLRDVEDESVCNRDTFRTLVTTATEQQSVEVIVTPPPPSPPLLLEGDEFYVSHDGVARTFYELSHASISNGAAKPFTVEELYDLEKASKVFVLRKEASSFPLGNHNQEVLSKRAEGVARLGQAVASFSLQEIDHGVFGSSGTGSTTWESSIVMSMIFSTHPELLRGDVIELGSGVGLGGILSQSPHPPDMRSMTLTDCNREVLDQCEKNIQQSHSMQHSCACSVSELNWHDFAEGKPRTKSAEKFCHKYDTVIASDCAYLYPDIVALSHTMEQLLRPNKQSRIHIFGPYNRGALQDLIILLQDKRKMNVMVNGIEINRYRLKAPPKGQSVGSLANNLLDLEYDECAFASRNVAKFLHITASLSTPDTCNAKSTVEKAIEDID